MSPPQQKTMSYLVNEKTICGADAAAVGGRIPPDEKVELLHIWEGKIL